MRVRTALRLAIAVLVVIGALIVAAQLDVFGVFGTDVLSAVGIARTNRIEVSRIVLEEVREIYQLSSIEYVYRTVFPYDFMDPAVSLDSMLATLRAGRGSIETLLSPVEMEFYRAYNLARDVGLGVSEDDFEFLVVTVIVGAGFDLADTLPASPSELSQSQLESVVAIEAQRVEGTIRRRITLPLPATTLTHVLIEDRDTASYPYPDVAIQPDEWRRVAAFVTERVRERTIQEGILEEADERGRRAIRSLLLESGYDEVLFR